MNGKIRFSWEGKNYEVDISAYDIGLIELPDGSILEAEEWLESYPPQPQNLRLVHNRTGAIKATEVK